MPDTMQSANLPSGKHTDIFAARLADKTAGRCSKEYCSVQRRLEMKSVIVPRRHGGMAQKKQQVA